MSTAAPVPPATSARVTRALTETAGTGATRLRGGTPPVASRWRSAAWSAGAVVAATLVAIVLVAPMMKGPSTVSAAEVLARSADRLARQATTGVESLEYELTLDGVPREMMPDHIDGAYRITQIIDHDTPGRYSMTAYGPGNELVWGVAQDPAAKRRVLALRIDGASYRFEFDVDGAVSLSAPEMERLHMEASVAMMQASGTQQLRIVESADGRQYHIEVPRVRAQMAAAVWDLTEAQAVIDARDYHVVALSVKGSFLKRPYSVSYRLIRRTVSTPGGVAAADFDLPEDPAAVRIAGEGSAVPVRDALVLALRELSKSRDRR